MFCERLSPQSSSSESPKRSETVSWIRSIVTWGRSPCGKTSFSTSCATSSFIGRPVSEQNATTRVSAPSSSRMLLDTRRAIGRHDDLTAALVERVEGVEEFFLDPFLVLEELHVVDEQQVVGAVALLESLDSLVAERVDEVVHEGLARHVPDGEVAAVLADVLRDRLHQMRLAE